MMFKDASVVVNKNQYTDRIIRAVSTVYEEYGLEPTCTSGNDGKHMKTSEHYKDRALDIRIWDLLNVIGQKIKAQLPDYYDVVVEKDHYHIEADSKKEQQHVPPSEPV